MEQKVKDLIKDLYTFYADRHIDEQSGERAVCWGCFAFSEFDKETGSFPKIKHYDDCEVVQMRKRIKELLSQEST